jgi:hypothetical protein
MKIILTNLKFLCPLYQCLQWSRVLGYSECRVAWLADATLLPGNLLQGVTKDVGVVVS